MKKSITFFLFLCMLLSVASCDNMADQGQINSTQNHTAQLTRFSGFTLDYFDTLSIVIGYAETREEFDYFSSLIISELRKMHMLFDIYHEHPGINNIRTVNINAGIAPVEVDPTIIQLLNASVEAYHLTGGVFNIALGPVLEVWHSHRTSYPHTLPDMRTLLAANEYSNIRDIIIDAENSTVFLPHENMSLDVGGIAKGFALEIAVARAREAGFVSFLLNMGGDVLTAYPPPGQNYWSVAVESPLGDGHVDAVAVSNMAVLASGDYRRFFVVDGIAYGHLIDPATLMPARLFRSVTVIHPRALYAEILSSAAFIMDINSGMELLAEHGAEAIWITYDGQIITTPGYARFSATR